MPNYDIFPDYLADRRRRNLLELALTVVCPNLKISKPAFKWISEKRFGAQWFDEDVLGWCAKDGRTIFIRNDCSPFEIANTVAHECRHCWQITNPKWFPVPNRSYTRGLTRQQKERDYRIFEMEFWNGREKRDGSFDEITAILNNIQIETSKAAIRTAGLPTPPARHPYEFGLSWFRPNEDNRTDRRTDARGLVTGNF